MQIFLVVASANNGMMIKKNILLRGVNPQNRRTGSFKEIGKGRY